MSTIAHPPVQCPTRTASAVLFSWSPSASAVLFLLWLSAWGLVVTSQPAQAQQAVYRCGQEYTNAPREPALCEPLAPQAITVINGTRPVPQPQPAAAAPTRSAPAEPVPTAPVATASAMAGQPRTPAVPTRLPEVQQSERDGLARTILMQELDKARAQLAQLVHSYNQGEPEKWAAETRNHQKYLDRVAGMLAAIERTERDIDSLQRELSRRPVHTSVRTP
jgi:hypothetical protein